MSTLLLTRGDIMSLMTPRDYFEAVETAFRLSKQGQAPSPPPMHIPGAGGGAFHAKGAAMLGDRKLAALKLNGNFPGNPARGLPTIQGAILLCDGETGALLAIMDSIEITQRRTAAATALAAKHLAPNGAQSFAIIGCGAQASAQIDALLDALPLAHGAVFDIDLECAAVFAKAESKRIGRVLRPAASLSGATQGADVIVTCTTSRTPFLDVDHVSPGAFIAAVGADNPEKSEITPALMARATVVADVLTQCLVMGDLHHAVAAGLLTATDVHAELGDLVAGARPGRTRADEIIVFDSTGTAIQDLTSAAIVFGRACERDLGTRSNLA